MIPSSDNFSDVLCVCDIIISISELVGECGEGIKYYLANAGSRDNRHRHQASILSRPGCSRGPECPGSPAAHADGLPLPQRVAPLEGAPGSPLQGHASGSSTGRSCPPSAPSTCIQLCIAIKERRSLGVWRGPPEGASWPCKCLSEAKEERVGTGGFVPL